MLADRGRALQAVLAALDKHGLLLLSDAALPSVVGTIVGEPLHGSWWGHPLGGVIYRVSGALEDDGRVLTTKLLGAKVTYVHHRLWPAVLAVGTAREAWQLDQLSPAARWLLSRIEELGEVQTNDVLAPAHLARKDIPMAARELERRLLIHASEIHTPSGAHAKVLETWQHWATRTDFRGSKLSYAEGKRELEEAAKALSGGVNGIRLLPWRSAVAF